MHTGYYSNQAVKDLLAIEEGKQDLLNKQIESLSKQIESLKEQITILMNKQ